MEMDTSYNSASNEASNTSNIPARRGFQDENNSFISLIGDPEYSDVTIYVGPREQEFKLHRNIICLKSAFFKAACKQTFSEGISREIRLPEIKPTSFEIIVKYIYGGRFRIDTLEKGHDEIVGAYEAADFLGIPNLKSEILEQFSQLILNSHPTGSKPEKSLKGVFQLLSKLSSNANLSDWDDLRKISDQLVLKRSMTTEKVQDMAQSSRCHNFFLGIVLDSYRRHLDSVCCDSCQRKLADLVGSSCKLCSKKLNNRAKRNTSINAMGG